MLQQGAGDLTLPLVRNERDGATNSDALTTIVKDFNAAAAANLENCHKMANMRLMLAIRNASTAAAETLTGDGGLAETVIVAPFGRTAARIAPPWPRRALRDKRCQ